MLYSIHYQSSHKKDADEIRCPYNQLGIIKTYPDKRYNITLSSKIEMPQVTKQLELLKAITDNYTIQCYDFQQLYTFLNLGYNAYIRFPIVDWESYTNLRRLEVSDIYIDGPLGFQADKIIASKGNTKIRVSPTFSPNATLTPQSEAPANFYIRPEDIPAYESMVDVIEFNTDSREKEDALFAIYKRGFFTFDIDMLVHNLPAGASNVMFKSEFAENRLNCGQRCKVPGRRCNYCKNYFTLVSKLKEKTSCQ